MANIRRIHTMGYIGITKDSMDNLSPPLQKKEKNNIPKNPVQPKTKTSTKQATEAKHKPKMQLKTNAQVVEQNNE